MLYIITAITLTAIALILAFKYALNRIESKKTPEFISVYGNSHQTEPMKLRGAHYCTEAYIKTLEEQTESLEKEITHISSPWLYDKAIKELRKMRSKLRSASAIYRFNAQNPPAQLQMF